MLDLETSIMISMCVLLTYTGIKIINHLFDRVDKKKKNSIF
jgi:hypothetical protein